jgi:hypothetical protein
MLSPGATRSGTRSEGAKEEEAMARPVSTGERHLELWRQREKRLSQLVLGTALFALLGEWKIVGPSARNAAEYAQSTAQGDALSRSLEQETARLAALEPVERALDRVDEAVAHEPWRRVIEDFKADFAALRSAAELVRTDVERARTVLVDPRFDAFRVVKPPEARSDDAAGSVLQSQQLPVLQQPARELMLQELQGRLEPPFLEGVQREAVLALVSLELDRDAVRSAAPPELVALIDLAMERRVAELAREKVAAIARAVSEGVIEPLEASLPSAPAEDLEFVGLRASLARNSERMTRWAADHITDRSWYRTVEAKGEAMTDLTGVLREWKQGFEQILGEQRRSLGAARQRASDAIVRIQADQGALKEKQAALSDQVEELLPEWVSGFVSPAELARTYPIIMAVLGGLIVALAGLVRHHFRHCRDETYGVGKTRTDAALSSCWTLVFRGRRATLWTLAAWVLGCGAWWWLTRVGLAHAELLWSDPFLGDALGDPSWLELARWSLLLAPLVVLLGVFLVIQDARMPTATPSSHAPTPD